MEKADLFEHYAKVALERLKQMPHETFKDFTTRKDFSDFLLNVMIAHYGLRCTCADAQDWDFNNAAGHYQHCDLAKFCHVVNRCLDWAEHINERKITELNETIKVLEAR